MIKQYTTKPIFEHDADYPWYRPGFTPAGTCEYPYQFPYFNSYPTYTVTKETHIEGCVCFSCSDNNELPHAHSHKHKDSKKHKKHNKKTIWKNALTVLLILIAVFIAAKLLL